MQAAISIEQLSKKYPDFTLQSLDLTLPAGSILGLIGENGAGKTTLLKSILGITQPTQGHVSFYGMDFSTHREECLEQIGVVFDGNTFHGKFTPRQIANIYRAAYKNWSDTLFSAYLQRFELSETKQIEELSKGMKMKLAIASTLSHQPRLLLLDEATGGLDPVVRDDILDLLLEFVQEEDHAILFSSHITSDLEKIADYVAFLHQGSLQFCENKDDLLYQMALVQVGKQEFPTIAREDLIAYREQPYGYQLLVSQPEAFRRKYQALTLAIDRPTLDDIMLLYVKGVR